jgi:hypothetical protein
LAATDHALVVTISVLAINDVRLYSFVNAANPQGFVFHRSVLRSNIWLGLEPLPSIFTDTNLSDLTVGLNSLRYLYTFAKYVVSNDFGTYNTSDYLTSVDADSHIELLESRAVRRFLHLFDGFHHLKA